MRTHARRLFRIFAVVSGTLTIGAFMAAGPAQASPRSGAGQATATAAGHPAALGGATAASDATAARDAATAGRPGPGSPYQPLPGLPVNACHDPSLPRDYGTNFPTPADPYGFGFANQSVIGWEGNIYAPFAYLSGSYFARGVPARYTQGGQSYCGAMYSFGVYTYGLAPGKPPAPGSVRWTMANGYLPALTTSFTRGDVAVSITDFADRQVIGGGPVELVYTRISVTNHGSQPVTVPPGQSGPGLVALGSAPDTVQPGATARHDFAAAVDTFSTSRPLPSPQALTPHGPHSGALPYGAAYAHMARYWNRRLSVIPRLSLPNVPLPGTNNLADPGTAIGNAYKAAFVYTRIVQVAAAPFSGADNYDWLLNHDLPGILANRFALGDFTDARNLLLVGRISESPSFSEVGANWYWDGVWRTPLAWAEYLELTGDTAFVRQYFHDDATGPSPWGPSLYTMMHTDYLSQLDASTGYLKASFDNDSYGTWLFDDETALAGLAAYRYIAARIGEGAEARWAGQAYTKLLDATNAGLAANEKANGFSFLPCEVSQPVTADRCGTPDDANWAGSNLWGQNAWTIYLEGGRLDGILGDPGQTDSLYRMGFARLAGSVPFPSFGAYTGYSVALNTAYAAGALYGTAYRDLPVTSYAWQIATTTGGPDAWWEANGSPPDPANPWAGSHAAPEFGAIPYAWPMAGQTQTLLQSLAAEGLTQAAGGHGTGYRPVLYIGRGVPDAWITPGQSVTVSNLTSSYDVASGRRGTYGVRITTGSRHGSRAVQVTLTGRVPSDDIQVQLPVFADAGVRSVTGGAYDAATHTVTVTPGRRAVQVLLGDAARPALQVSVTSTAGGQHAQPMLTDGQAATASATITNTGHSPLTGVRLTLTAPGGWTVTAVSPASFAQLGPGQSQTATWQVTPASDADGGYGLVASAAYTAPYGTSGSVSAEQWVRAQPPLPLQPGAEDLAPSGSPSASYTSPWTTVSAINDGIYPPRSHDTADPYWGTWPQQGSQWIELDWAKPVTADAAAIYFWSDGSGVLPPASWTIQYWNGSAFVPVTGASGYGTKLDTFNSVTFQPVTTTRLRAVFDTGYTGTCTGACHAVGVLQWVVDGAAAPGT